MPTAPARVCPQGHVVSRPGPCRVCARQADQSRPNANTRGYTHRWYLRARAFRARYPLCGMRPGNRAPVLSYCAEVGRTTPGDVVDHVVPHRGNMALFWDELNNWQTLCRACHTRKSMAGL